MKKTRLFQFLKKGVGYVWVLFSEESDGCTISKKKFLVCLKLYTSKAILRLFDLIFLLLLAISHVQRRFFDIGKGSPVSAQYTIVSSLSNKVYLLLIQQFLNFPRFFKNPSSIEN